MDEFYREQRAAEAVAGALAFVWLRDAYGTDGDSRVYDVRLRGESIGRVRSYRSESWATNASGTIRTRLLGRPKVWVAEVPGVYRRGARHDTRRAAAADLALAYVRRSTPDG